jgi:F-box-like
MSPIDILPPELLIEIFVYCSWRWPAAATTLSLICRSWNDIIHTSPRVWQLISVEDSNGQSIESLQRQTARWMTKSSPMPFDIDISLTNSDTRNMILPIFSAVLPQLHRWRTCSFQFGERKEVMDIARIFCESLLRGASGIEDALVGLIRVEVRFVDAERRWHALELPSFQMSHTGGVILHVPVDCLPPPSLINPIPVTSLTISEQLFIEQGALQVLSFLTAFPHLESFVYHGTHIDPIMDVSTYPEFSIPPVVSLPRLQHLVLRSTCAVRTILSRLDVPMLTVLHLEHLNVDFEFHEPHAFSREEGDSEDEEPDFSQSPCSDRALGMGLRRLQSRCHPPVQTLMMDYADLRTKDFQYCFENFPLRKFRIVASDMSDRVIHMLKPYEDPAGVLCVRLPQLVSLELINCHQFSGNAVIDALSARARFVDQSGHLPAIEHVAIVGCSDISHHHNLALSQALGSRFHAAGKPVSLHDLGRDCMISTFFR